MTIRSMPTFMAHGLVLLATLAGIVGFGLIYDAFAHHNPQLLTIGAPLLFAGLWWAGRELGRSNLAARRRRILKQGSSATER